MLHPNDERKISRSLQIFRQTRKRPSDLLGKRVPRFPKICVLWIDCELPVLDVRLDRRVDDMMSAGLLAELLHFNALLQQAQPQALMTEGQLDYTKGILQAIGFKEFKSVLVYDRPVFHNTRAEDATADESNAKAFAAQLPAKRMCTGQPVASIIDSLPHDPLMRCLEDMKRATRRYARRQLLWVRRRFLQLQVPSYAVYRLDSTRVDCWDTEVAQPAMEVAHSFLASSAVWPPQELQVRRADKQEPAFSLKAVPAACHNRCEACNNRLFVGDHQWQMHLLSRSHRKRAAQLRKRASQPVQPPLHYLDGDDDEVGQ